MRILLLLAFQLAGEIFVFAKPAVAVPVIPAFKQGTLTSHTETTSKVTETIVSEDFATGFEYSASGTNIAPTAPEGNINPIAETTVNGWTSLGQRPNWSIVNQGQPFQFVESLHGPGLSNRTTIQRVTEITSTTDVVSTFSE